MDRSEVRAPRRLDTPGEPEEQAAPEPLPLLRDLVLGRGETPQPGVQTRQIRASSALVLGGVCLGLAGIASLALAQFQDRPQGLRELGGVLGGLGLLVLLWGILAGLPSARLFRRAGSLGAVVGLLGLAAFAWAYPQNWGKLDAPDHSVTVMATYTAGVVLLVGATFAALVADFVLRMQVRGRLRTELGREPTDEEIQRDIDEAMRKHRVTWGGVVADEGTGLRVKVESLPSEWAAIMPKIGRETVASGERVTAVDNAVDKLLEFRGGRNRTGAMPEAGVGDAANALRALRAAQPERRAKRGWLDRLLHPFAAREGHARRNGARDARPGTRGGPPGPPPR
jgi:hypothetical protein